MTVNKEQQRQSGVSDAQVQSEVDGLSISKLEDLSVDDDARVQGGFKGQTVRLQFRTTTDSSL